MARPQCDTPLVHITFIHQMVVLRPQYKVISIQWYANIKLKMFKSTFIKVSQTIGISYWDAILKEIEFCDSLWSYWVISNHLDIVIGLPKFVAHTRFSGKHFLSLSYHEFNLSEFLIVFILVFLKMLFFLSFRPITYVSHIHKSWNMICACFANFPSIIWDMCKLITHFEKPFINMLNIDKFVPYHFQEYVWVVLMLHDTYVKPLVFVHGSCFHYNKCMSCRPATNTIKTIRITHIQACTQIAPNKVRIPFMLNWDSITKKQWQKLLIFYNKYPTKITHRGRGILGETIPKP